MATKIVILLGPTCVGKTAYSLALARQWDSPIINCDSRQVFKELAIGVARPPQTLLDQVRHYFIATHSIHQPYSAGQYELEAWDLVQQLAPSHETLLMVGGSGLYIDAFCNGMDDFPAPDPELRAQLNALLDSEGGLEQLRAQLQRMDPETYRTLDLSNRRRVLRAVEVCLLSGRSYASFKSHPEKERPFPIEKIGLDCPRDVLYDRINARVDAMVEEGLEAEARALYPYKDLPALQTVGYREWFDCFEGLITPAKAVELIKRNTRHYAKRQMSYWRRDSEIQWIRADQ